MLRRVFLLAAMASPAAGTAWAQANLRPDPTPRLPPQPGQGLPIEDLRFLRDAGALSTAQAEAATRAGQASTDAETRRFAEALAGRHRALAQEIATLARQHGGAGAAQAGGEAPAGRVGEALQRLRGLGSGATSGEREFLAAELEVHPVLIEMYQVQASNTAIPELGRFAITSMVGLQEDFTTAARLGQRQGLAPPERLLGNPPQYGPGAGPAR